MKKIYFRLLVHFFSALISFISYNGHCQYPAGRARTGDNYHFSNIRTLQKSTVTNNNNYKFVYSIKGGNKKGFYFFSIKQVYANGNTRFSNIRSVELKSSGLQKFNFYSDASDGIVGIKFDDIFGGKQFTQVINTQGQSVVNKEILVSGVLYCQIARLQASMYWLKLKDVTANYPV